MGTPREIADILEHDFGPAGARKYAARIARSSGPLAGEYADALRILETRAGMCEECGKYPKDGGRLCAGCEAYQDHTSVY